MSKDFVKSWSTKEKVSTSQGLTGRLRRVPLKDRLMKTIYGLNNVQQTLEHSRLNMEQKHKALFSKCLHAQETKDMQTAVMYANECAQVKKIVQTIVTSQLSLEQVGLRLETVADFGDIAAEILPAASVVRSVKGRLSGVIPEVSMQLGTISSTLDSLMLEAGEATGQSWNVLSSGEDAEKILAEAATIAEQKVKEGFPDLPSTSSAQGGVNSP